MRSPSHHPPGAALSVRASLACDLTQRNVDLQAVDFLVAEGALRVGNDTARMAGRVHPVHSGVFCLPVAGEDDAASGTYPVDFGIGVDLAGLKPLLELRVAL